MARNNYATEGKPAQFKCRFIWTIEHFSSIHKSVGEKIFSPEFSMGVENGDESRWYLSLYPNGFKTDGHISVLLHLKNCNCEEVRLCVHFAILNWIGNSCKRVVYKNILFRPGENRGTSCLITREALLNVANGFLLGDNLKVECVFGVASTDEAPQLRYYEELMLTTTKTESNEYWPLYTDQRHVDTTISVKNKTFGVHRVVLAANCKVFDTMFSHNMKEASTNTVTIDDCEPEVFGEFLRFIYTGGVGNIDEVAVGLLILAERYNMEKLKDICLKEILKTLTVNSACEMLVVSHTHNASWLKDQTLEFMKANLLKITETKEWSNMVNHPTLMEDLIKSLAENL